MTGKHAGTGRDGSYRALPIHWWTRCRIVHAARADRRAGLPVGLGPGTTPALRALAARHDDVCEHERSRYLADVAGIDVRLAEIGAALPALERSLAESADAVTAAGHPPTADRLAARRAGEQDLPEALVRQRREAEHRRVLDAARDARDDAERRLAALHREQARLLARRRHRADVARSRALRHGEHTERLAALYRRALARRHPQREALLTEWRTDLDLRPAWVAADDIASSARAEIAPPARAEGAAA